MMPIAEQIVNSLRKYISGAIFISTIEMYTCSGMTQKKLPKQMGAFTEGVPILTHPS